MCDMKSLILHISLIYQVRLKSSKQKIETQSNFEPKFTVTGLKPGKEYTLEVTAINSQGESDPMAITHLTPIDIAEKRLSKTPGDDGSFPVQTFVGVLVGVLSVFFLCCIMAVITIKVSSQWCIFFR